MAFLANYTYVTPWNFFFIQNILEIRDLEIMKI